MLIIRQEQIDTMVMGDEDEFVEFLVNHVKQEDPDLEEEYEDETLGEMVRGGIERAKSHGFTTSEDITAFVSLMFEIAPNFDEQSEIRAVLDDENTPPDQRFDKLWSPLVPEEAWDEAAEKYDENAWTYKEKA